MYVLNEFQISNTKYHNLKVIILSRYIVMISSILLQQSKCFFINYRVLRNFAHVINNENTLPAFFLICKLFFYDYAKYLNNDWLGLLA